MGSPTVDEANAKPKKPRRWPRFGLATLFGIVTLSAILVALIVSPAERQKRAVAAIRSLGGEVHFEDDSRRPLFSWLRKRFGDDYFGNVVLVFLNDTPISDADLRHLQELTGLRKLYLSNTQVTDEGLTHISRLTNLQELDLCNTQVSDAGLEHLNVLAGLKHLAVLNTRVSSAGAAELSRDLPRCVLMRNMDTETIAPDDR